MMVYCKNNIKHVLKTRNYYLNMKKYKKIINYMYIIQLRVEKNSTSCTHTTGTRYTETVLFVLTSSRLYRGKGNAGSNTLKASEGAVLLNNSCACAEGVRTSFDLCWFVGVRTTFALTYIRKETFTLFNRKVFCV